MQAPMKNTRHPWKWLAAALLLFAVGIAYTAWSYQQIDKASEQRRESRGVINLADDLASALKDAETSQRGYLLTGNQAYLEPYLAVRDGVVVHLAALRDRTTFPQGRAALDLVEPLIKAKMATLAQLIELRRAGNTKAVLLVLEGGDAKDRERHARFAAAIAFLARIEPAAMRWLGAGETAPAAATAVVGELKLLIPLLGLIDVDAEIKRLARAGTRVVHCPSANMKLGSGIAPLRAFREHGLVVGLGADGAACNNRLDAFTEMRQAALLSCAREQDALATSAAEALRLATLDGARHPPSRSAPGCWARARPRPAGTCRRGCRGLLPG